MLGSVFRPPSTPHPLDNLAVKVRKMASTRHVLCAASLALLVAVAACSTDSTPSTTDTTMATTTSATPTLPQTSTTSAEATTTTNAPTTTSILPGEPYDLFVPGDGEVVAVVGVAFDDVLNVREGPGIAFPIIETLAPTATDVIGTGEGRLIDISVWWKVVANGSTGWVNSRFISRLGGVDDLTSVVVDRVGEIPKAETMLDLGLTAANALASVDPSSDISMTVAPTVGDLGEVTYDVIGLGDDSVNGYRLHVFGQPIDEAFSLMAVEVTYMCTRGRTAEGMCA